MKILLVDDDPIVILLQTKLMEKAGIPNPVIPFNSGNDVLAYLLKSTDDSEDHLVFLDINMPGLSGWEVLDTLTEMEVKLKLKVIIITSSIEDSDQKKAGGYDVIVDFWIKPFSIQDFINLKESQLFKNGLSE
ncbi:MAG: response regulator [Cyclobacteriaceae bacterium]